MLFNRTDPAALTKSVGIYISRVHARIIISPRHRNDAGIEYEQDACSVLDLPIDPLALGEEVLRNFHLFSLSDSNLRDRKRTDWPAFRHSKLPSVRSFENSYICVDVSGNNESNLILVIEAPFSGHDAMSITSRVSSAPASHRMVGERILRVFESASG